MKEFPPISEVIELLKDTDSQSEAVKFAKGRNAFTMPIWVRWVDIALTASTYLLAAIIYWLILSGTYEVIKRWFNG